MPPLRQETIEKRSTETPSCATHRLAAAPAILTDSSVANCDVLEEWRPDITLTRSCRPAVPAQPQDHETTEVVVVRRSDEGGSPAQSFPVHLRGWSVILRESGQVWGIRRIVQFPKASD